MLLRRRLVTLVLCLTILVTVGVALAQAPLPAQDSGATIQAPVQLHAGTDIVYITRTGEKYHRSGCQYLRLSKIATTRSEAIKSRYTACSVCNP